MELRPLGATGTRVPSLCLGTMTFGLQCDEPTSNDILDAAWEKGLTFLDTADVYPLGGGLETVGATEDIIGRWMAERGNRDDVFLATKCRGRMGQGHNDQGLSRFHIQRAVDASLKRLRTDVIDLYQVHFLDQHTPIEETLREIGPEPEGAEGGESGGPVCDPGPGESVRCIETPEDGECPDCINNHCSELFNDGSGCFAKDLRITCGPMAANEMCCYTYTSSGEVCDGRPFVVGGVARTASVQARRDWAAPLGAERRGPWIERALDEHASIAAFAKFILELLSVGAPADLVADAAAAMRDEVEHARLCFGLAGAEVGPGPLPTADMNMGRDLDAIARATLLEGAIGETLAAARAATEASSERDPTVRRALEQIADDETRHAALAWRFIRWALARDPGLRPQLQRTLDDALREIDPTLAHHLIEPAWAASQPRVGAPAGRLLL